MLIKFDADSSEVDLLKAFSGEKVGSKAFYRAAIAAPDLSTEVRKLRAQLNDANDKIRSLKQTMEAARSSAARLIEDCSQSDFFSD